MCPEPDFDDDVDDDDDDDNDDDEDETLFTQFTMRYCWGAFRNSTSSLLVDTAASVLEQAVVVP